MVVAKDRSGLSSRIYKDCLECLLLSADLGLETSKVLSLQLFLDLGSNPYLGVCTFGSHNDFMKLIFSKNLLFEGFLLS